VTRPAARTLAVDAVSAVCLTVFMAFGTIGASNDNPPAPPDVPAMAFVLVAVAGAALVLRRFLPLACLAVVAGAVTTYLALDFVYGPILFAVGIATYSVAAHRPIRRSLPAAVLTAVALTVPFAIDTTGGWISRLAQVIAWNSWLLAAWAVGVAARTVRASRAQTRAERQRQETYEERLRTAQDVHDIVGHGLAAISMQAGVALHVLDRSPQRARDLLESIRQSSQQSLEELRATLAVFRSSGAAPDELAPLAGLDQLPSLVGRMADSGVPVELTTSGQPVPVLASVDNAAYRIVQESLTNVLRHAGPTAAAATVHLGWSPDRLVVRIADGGRGPGQHVVAGQGLAGMQARAEGVGGTLTAGPGDAGGFRVHAELPLAGHR